VPIPFGGSHVPSAVVQLSPHAPPLHPDMNTENVESPKFTSPENAWTVLRSAHLASLMRVGSMLHEFFGAVLGHEFGKQYASPAPLQKPSPFVSMGWGFVQAIMLPDVSTTTMKYGFDGAGHWRGSVDKHAAGSGCAAGTIGGVGGRHVCAFAGSALITATSDAPAVTSPIHALRRMRGRAASTIVMPLSAPERCTP
jgi:hypothetical protein